MTNPNGQDSDRELVYIWLGDKSKTTQVSYSSIVTGFFDFINKPLAQVATRICSYGTGDSS